MRHWLPWYAKIAAKLILSRLPLPYGFWRRLNLFAHGAMHKPEYAYEVFRRHFDRSPFARKDTGFVALEIGPGDSLLSAVIAKAHGASTCYLIDVGKFATSELTPYLSMAAHLTQLGLNAPDLSDVSTIPELLARCNAVYLTEGLLSLNQLADGSVDFVWSQAVLEHIRRHEFPGFIRELRRVLRPDGVCSHRIDLRDHLGGALNNRRIPSRYWEADWMARSGFYTNRLSYGEILHTFESAGFNATVLNTEQWKTLPTPKEAMAREFQHCGTDELRISGFDVLLRPR